MKTLTTLFIALSLTGCGLFSSAPAAQSTTTPAAEEQPSEPSAFAWQTELRRVEQGKITEKLWLWLDDGAVDGVEVETVATMPLVRVTAKLREPLSSAQAADLAAQGLEATEGAETTTGLVSREQLMELARQDGVVRIDPAADAEARAAAERRQDRRRARASARRRGSRM